MIEQSAEIAKAIRERSKKELREVIVEALQREPTDMEWEIAASSFYMGALATALAMIESFEGLHTVRN